LLGEDYDATLAWLILKSPRPPAADIADFIIEAAKRHPLNQTIAGASASLAH
jgi:hypothetical protein